ncbi:hypothetical protein [Neorhizobium galegae]|uniref:Uncharacterized protein n=1 Tax=Neorhizobium galegae bv. orientalis str. HAMBI 540 TaxID=1028800 RepID=A0A068SPU9_NEOGA|nr:hypothetical protein [Neorhizobium galegae]CDN48253.1 Hypothetical protein RG540_CH20840 [Neorhizobium galegae bv. orientalis str. HAMBI 540]
MSLLRNSIVHVGSWAALVGFGLWAYYDPGFEPVIALIAGVVGIVTNVEDLPLGRGSRRKLTPEKKIELRDKWGPVFKDFFLRTARDSYRTDVIVHDVARLDHYPDVEEKGSGISSWFRVGFMGTYQRGILLGLRWTYLKQGADDNWHEYQLDGPDDVIKVILLAEVPYEVIESFNPDGDNFYHKPHLYLHFDYGGQPYERLFYGEQRRLFEDSPFFYSQIAEFKPPPWIQRLKEKCRLF